MAVQVTLNSNTPRTVSVPAQAAKIVKSTGASKQAKYQSIDASSTHLSYTNVQDIIEELANRFYQRTTAPTVGINEGDLWYDLTNNKLKNYDGSSWGLISGAASALQDTDFLFTAESEISSGHLAKFQNKDSVGSSVDIFTVRYDGVIELKNQSTTPTATEGGMYYNGDNLYIGVSSGE